VHQPQFSAFCRRQTLQKKILNMVLGGLCALMFIGISGCNGRSIKVDNPVFASAPPRRSLVNESADAEEARIAKNEAGRDIKKAGFSPSDKKLLTGNTVVASIDSHSVFLDDVLGGYRRILEQRSEIPDEFKQQLLMKALKEKLPGHIDQEIVMKALNAKIPEDRRESIRETMEPQFQKLLEKIRTEKNLQTDQELEEILAGEGMSIALLRDMFMRTQMVNGYVSTIANAPKTIDRQELVEYYQKHLNDYTPSERVRYSEIVVRFSLHGGKEGAEKVMQNVQEELKKGREFGDVAAAFSDNLSAEKNGDLGWIERGSLADKDLETLLFELPVGKTTPVLTRGERLEMYRVVNHSTSESIPFQDVQKEIEKTLLNQKAEAARAAVLKDLKSKATITTIFDEA
jgi:hypothetical protein